MFDNDVSAEVLQALYSLKSGYRVQQLNSHGAQHLKFLFNSGLLKQHCFAQKLLCHRSSMQEEEVSAWSWVLDGVFNELDDCVAFKLCEAAKAEITCTKIGLLCGWFCKQKWWRMYFLPWSCSILTCRTNPLSLNVKLKISRNCYPHTGG